MNRVSLGFISMMFLIALSINNMVVLIIQGRPFVDFITHVGIFVVLIFALIISKKQFPERKIHAWIFFISGALGQIMSEPGNFAPAYFFVLSIYCYQRRAFIIAVIFTAVVSLFAKVMVFGYSQNVAITMLLFQAVIFFYYFKLWHSQKIRIEDIPGFDTTDIAIIEGMVSGAHVKETAYHLGLSPSSIRSRQEAMRRRMGVQSNTQLIYQLSLTQSLRKMQ